MTDLRTHLGSDLRHRQDGVVSRVQLLESGTRLADLKRALRRHELTPHAPGVYVDHTGPLTERQRRWVAVLALWPAALCHQSVVRTDEPPGAVVHVAIDRRRSAAPRPGVRVHHVTDLDERVQWNASPPRVRLEEAAVSVAAEARDDLAAIAALADLVQARRTTPDRLRAAVDSRHRLPRRHLLRSCLEDLAAGTCSALEQGYLQRVERAHGLPAAARQVRDSRRGLVFRDVVYGAHELVVELDGRVFHSDARARSRDLERDFAALLDGLVTVRLGWGQVFGGECATAAGLGDLLRRRGWDGQQRACPRCPVPPSGPSR